MVEYPVAVEKNGRVAMKGQNLECLTRYARECAFAFHILIKRHYPHPGADIVVSYDDGARGHATFESATVAREWAVERTRVNRNFRDDDANDSTCITDVTRDAGTGEFRPTILLPIG